MPSFFKVRKYDQEMSQSHTADQTIAPRGRNTSIIWENGSYRNRENLQYSETADSVLFSLLMRTNGKNTSSHVSSIRQLK